MPNYSALLSALGALFLVSCAGVESAPSEGISREELQTREYADYVIGPYDEIRVLVWQTPELSTDVRVRPDGRISTPLISDMVAAGKSPSELSDDIENALTQYVRSPQVTVIVTGFSSTFDQQIRVLGEAQQPTAIPYQAGMTVLDVMIAVGGLSEFAAGNRAKLIRLNRETGTQEEYRLRLSDLLKRGDSTANVLLKPGDTISIPESRF